jgi:hypothetical protein
MTLLLEPTVIQQYISDFKFQKAIINTIIVQTDNEHKRHAQYDNVYQFITSNFDLSFCKVAFDGNKLYIKNVDNIQTKSGIVDIDLEKYITRYLYLREPSDSFDWTEKKSLMAKLLKRVEKYKQRGFKVINEQDAIDFSLIKAKRISYR